MSVFISIEGIEGSGKSSVISALAAHLASLGLTPCQTREPGGTALGVEIRRLLLQASPAPCGLAELLLFAADRAQHLAEVVRPALQQGEVVISDRYADSTLAYQGFARGVSRELLDSLHLFATDNLQPDLTLLLDLPVELGLERAARRRGSDHESWTRFEAEKLEFHQAVRNGFLALAAASPERFSVIDASRTLEQVAEAAVSAADNLLRGSGLLK